MTGKFPEALNEYEEVINQINKIIIINIVN